MNTNNDLEKILSNLKEHISFINPGRNLFGVLQSIEKGSIDDEISEANKLINYLLKEGHPKASEIRDSYYKTLKKFYDFRRTYESIRPEGNISSPTNNIQDSHRSAVNQVSYPTSQNSLNS